MVSSQDRKQAGLGQGQGRAHCGHAWWGPQVMTAKYVIAFTGQLGIRSEQEQGQGKVKVGQAGTVSDEDNVKILARQSST